MRCFCNKWSMVKLKEIVSVLFGGVSAAPALCFNKTFNLEKAVHYHKGAKKSEGYSIFCNHLLGASTICLSNRFPSRSLRLCGSNATFRFIAVSFFVNKDSPYLQE